MKRVLLLLLACLCVPQNGPPVNAQQTDQGSAVSEKSSATVNLSWAVLPEKLTKDSFGKQVSQNFYAIEVMLSNETGSTIIVKAFTFQASGPSRIPPESLSLVMARTSGKKTAQLCKEGFHADLIVSANRQVRTYIFVRRELLGLRNSHKHEDLQQVKKALGDLAAIAQEVQLLEGR